MSARRCRGELSAGKLRWRSYDPADPRSVPTLELDDSGDRGSTANNPPGADGHHRYDKMHEWFARYLNVSIAGKDILVETEEFGGATDLACCLVIATPDNREVRLQRVFPATPCAEFSGFALRFPAITRPDEALTEAIRALSDGMRGYYASWDGPARRIEFGDLVIARWARGVWREQYNPLPPRLTPHASGYTARRTHRARSVSGNSVASTANVAGHQGGVHSDARSRRGRHPCLPLP